MKHDLYNLILPKDSRNKQLEIISKDIFRPLFDVKKFIVRKRSLTMALILDLKLN